MKLTKSQLRKIIKEELGELQEQTGGSVWVVYDFNAGGRGFRILGIYDSREGAGDPDIGAGVEVMEVPLNTWSYRGHRPQR